jgi:hypothetical protein
MASDTPKGCPPTHGLPDAPFAMLGRDAEFIEPRQFSNRKTVRTGRSIGG